MAVGWILVRATTFSAEFRRFVITDTSGRPFLIFRWRKPDLLFEFAPETGGDIITHRDADFFYGIVRGFQQEFRPFQTHLPNVIGEINMEFLYKQGAHINGADMEMISEVLESEIRTKTVFLNKTDNLCCLRAAVGHSVRKYS